MNRAEIDYISPFVKAWAAFNAWFRHASAKAQERAMLDWVKGQPNPVRRGVLALLRNENDTAEPKTPKAFGRYSRLTATGRTDSSFTRGLIAAPRTPARILEQQ